MTAREGNWIPAFAGMEMKFDVLEPDYRELTAFSMRERASRRITRGQAIFMRSNPEPDSPKRKPSSKPTRAFARIKVLKA